MHGDLPLEVVWGCKAHVATSMKAAVERIVSIAVACEVF